MIILKNVYNERNLEMDELWVKKNYGGYGIDMKSIISENI